MWPLYDLINIPVPWVYVTLLSYCSSSDCCCHVALLCFLAYCVCLNAGWASITQRGGFRSKPKRYRPDRNQNVHVTTCSVQHGCWAPKIEAISKPKIPNHLEIESIEPRPTLECIITSRSPQQPPAESSPKTRLWGLRGGGYC